MKSPMSTQVGPRALHHHIRATDHHHRSLSRWSSSETRQPASCPGILLSHAQCTKRSCMPPLICQGWVLATKKRQLKSTDLQSNRSNHVPKPKPQTWKLSCQQCRCGAGGKFSQQRFCFQDGASIRRVQQLRGLAS